MMFMYMLLCVLLMMLILILLITISGSYFLVSSSSKMSSFECGMFMKGASHNFFSLRFFVLCLVFLVFDVELIMLLPCLSVAGFMKTLYLMLTSLYMILMIFVLLFEQSYGSLKWVK